MSTTHVRTMFVNIYFQAIDCHLTDKALLQNILWHLEERRASLTSRPDSRKNKNCFSFEVRGCNEACVYTDAINRVKIWIWNLPTSGLPFDRAGVFQSGLGISLPQ